MANKGLNDLLTEKDFNEELSVTMYDLKSDFKMLVINLDGTYKCYLKYKDNNNLLYCYSLNKSEFDKLDASKINQNVNDYINIWIDSYAKL